MYLFYEFSFMYFLLCIFFYIFSFRVKSEFYLYGSSLFESCQGYSCQGFFSLCQLHRVCRVYRPKGLLSLPPFFARRAVPLLRPKGDGKGQPFGLASSSKGGQAKRKEEGGSSVGLSLPFRRPKGELLRSKSDGTALLLFASRIPFSHRPKGFAKRKEEERRDAKKGDSPLGLLSPFGGSKAKRKEEGGSSVGLSPFFASPEGRRRATGSKAQRKELKGLLRFTDDSVQVKFYFSRLGKMTDT
jgi:hypothetical protein